MPWHTGGRSFEERDLVDSKMEAFLQVGECDKAGTARRILHTASSLQWHLEQRVRR